MRPTDSVKEINIIYIYTYIAEARTIHSRLNFRITNMGRLTFALFVCLAVLYQSQAKQWDSGKLLEDLLDLEQRDGGEVDGDNGSPGQDGQGGEILIAVLTIQYINIILFQHRFRIFLQIWTETGRMYITRP